MTDTVVEQVMNARIADLEAQLLSTCQREAETIQRYDQRIERLEAEIARLKALLDAADAYADGRPSTPPNIRLERQELAIALAQAKARAAMGDTK